MNAEQPSSPAQVQRLVGRIREYLSNGGLFNPECMDHEKVRDLLMDVLEHLTTEKPHDAGDGEKQ